MRQPSGSIRSTKGLETSSSTIATADSPFFIFKKKNRFEGVVKSWRSKVGVDERGPGGGSRGGGVCGAHGLLFPGGPASCEGTFHFRPNTSLVSCFCLPYCLDLDSTCLCFVFLLRSKMYGFLTCS